MAEERRTHGTMCPRCEKGWMVPEWDRHGPYRTCVMCGFVDEWLPGGRLALVPPQAEAGQQPVQRQRDPMHRRQRL